MLAKFITLVCLASYSLSSYADLIIPEKRKVLLDHFSLGEVLTFSLVLVGVIILLIIWYVMRKNK
ncbi:Uncharacterised protein [Legionella hackeliae]|nr:hypothetical protein Lhac_2059 [Legionella hackeliae]STX47725.1 Uncharacterised protein [Legionella hackeliae]